MSDRKQRPSLEELDSTDQPLMLIHLAYRETYVLPWDLGKQLLDILSRAELFDDNHIAPPGGRREIRRPEITMMSRSEYRNRKMAQLLKVTYEELTNSERDIENDDLPPPF